MRDVYLVGAGRSDYGSFPDGSCRSPFRTAYEHARDSVPGGLAATDLDVGDWVGTAIRWVYRQEGVVRYGQKASVE